MGFSLDNRDDKIAALEAARAQDHRTIDAMAEQLLACESLLRAARLLVIGWPKEHDARHVAFLLATGRFASPETERRSVPTYMGPDASAPPTDVGTHEQAGT